MYKHGFLKVMAVTPKIIAGDIINNTNEILRVLNSTNASVVVFPELTLTGYSTSDLFYQEKTLNDALEGLKTILKENKHQGLAAIGMPLDINGGLFNVAVVINKDKILGIVPKNFLPNNQEFQEKRWFLSGTECKLKTVTIFNKKIPFGNLIFKDEAKNIAIGIEICQDLWSIKTPADDLAMAGANIILNLSASTELVYKERVRRNAILDHSRKQMGAYIYTTTGIFESSSEAVYSSHKLIGVMGDLVAESETISYNADSLVADISITAINYRRRQDSNYRDSIFKNSFQYREIKTNFNETDEYIFDTKIDKRPFIPKREKDLNKIYQILTASLVKKLTSLPENNRKIVLGLSGGLDSAHALIIAYAAFKVLNLPLSNLYPIIMPAKVSTAANMNDAEVLAKELGLEYQIIPIQDSVDQHLKDINHQDKDVTYENAQARIRTLILMDLANKYQGFVLGTGDLSEIALGFMTYNGDQMSMYAVNSGIPKTLMQELMVYYANNEYHHIKEVVMRIVNKKISPELLNDQSSEEIIGSYLINDFIMYYHLEKGFDEQQLEWLISNVFNLSKIDSKTYVKRFLTRFYNQQFKRTTMPEGPKVFDLSLSPRVSYQMPSDIKKVIK